MPIRDETSPRLNRFGAICIGVGIVATTWATLPPPSTSRMQTWPWSLLPTLAWLTWIIAGTLALAKNRRLLTSFTGAGLALLSLTAVISAYTAFLPGISLPAALPLLAGCCAPFAFNALLWGRHRQTWLRALGLSAAVVTVVSFYLWVTTRVGPAFASGQPIGTALKARNDQPFGHGNYVAAFSLLALGMMGACLVRASHRWARLGWYAGMIAGVVILFSSGSRAGLIALVAGLGGFVFMSRSALPRLSRKHGALVVLGVFLVLAAGVLGNSRLREFVQHGRWNAVSQESNQQRLGMAQAAVALGFERPLFGWGPGAIPQVFPSVRAAAAGNVDNVIQVHSSVLQTWATLGTAGMIAVLLIATGSVSALVRRSPATGSTDTLETRETAALGAGLTAFAVYSFFDHSLDIPAMALLACAALGVVALPRTAPTPSAPSAFRIVVPLAVAALALLLAGGVYRDQVARRAYSEALDHVVRRDPAGFQAALQRADRAVPDATYASHVLASWLATGQPFSHQPPLADNGAAAIVPLEASLLRNPFLEYAHYNLGWLYLAAQPAKAEKHFLSAALLAPHRIGVHLGLGLARMAQNNLAGAATAFAAEWVNDPRQAFGPLFREPALAELIQKTAALAQDFLRNQIQAGHLDSRQVDEVVATWHREDLRHVAAGTPFRRARPGYGVLMGFPEGRPPADVNVMTTPQLPPAVQASLPRPGWVNGERLLALSLGERGSGEP